MSLEVLGIQIVGASIGMLLSTAIILVITHFSTRKR